MLGFNHTILRVTLKLTIILYVGNTGVMSVDSITSYFLEKNIHS